MLQNTPVQRLKGGNPTSGLPSGRLVTHPMELNITFKPRSKESRTESLTRNYGRKTIQRKWKKHIIMKHATWNVGGIVHKEEKLESILNEKQIKIAAITESKKKLNCTSETNNYILIYSGVYRSI
jgi:hypothetical protein